METEPFGNLDDLYSKLENLIQWPETMKLRECAEYVYAGNQADVTTGELKRLNRDSKPRTIVCHDMMGGYLEDRFINGSTVHDSYLFYHWNLIDTFIYFSHKMVTVPPYGWINAAHSHGVKVLGTVITERTDGEIAWDRILSSRDEIRKFANALIRIAKFYQFEGWLLNVENKIKKEKIEDLIYFVKYLTDSIHIEMTNSEIIWYDSVTHDGILNWQNALNSHNERFFDNCDGIFLNYNWTDRTLAGSKTIAKKNNRIRDVYVGLDVWGRGCPGGGGFNSVHALERIRKQELSVAIFAPGWTHENFGAQTFRRIENIFWAQLLSYLYIHVPIYDNEIFATSFCRGAGPNYYRLGQLDSKVSSDNGLSTTNPFFNLSKQKPQILAPGLHLKFTYTDIPPRIESKDKNTPSEQPECTFETPFEILKVTGRRIIFLDKDPSPRVNCTEYCEDYSYDGGSCLKIITEDTRLYHRLFLVHIDFEQEIQASLVYKKTNEISELNVHASPILILGNDAGIQRIRAFETLELTSQWRKSIYLTNLRTVNEIGVAFSQTGNCCLGELVIEPKLQRFGIVLVVFGVLVLVHGASLGGSGAGLWAGAGALVAGALGVVATLATSSSTKTPQQRAPATSGFATAHLASSLVALALSNMSAITALTAVVRDSQRPTETNILLVPGEDGNLMEVEGGWAGLLASIGLLIASVAELLIAGYSCVTLTPKLCGCLRSNVDENPDGKLKTRNMVHQWVVAQNHVPKNQPIYVVQPVMPMHPMMQAPYGIPPAHGKYPGFVPAGAIPIPTPGYGPVPVMPHMIHANRPPSQMVRPRHHKRYIQSDQEEAMERSRRHPNNQDAKSVDSSSKRMASIGEDQVDLAQTYTGLDKRISEEFISIAMDPDRKSKASSHHGSEIGTGSTRPS